MSDDFAKALAAMGKAAQQVHDALALAAGRALLNAVGRWEYDPDAWMYAPHPQQRLFVRIGFAIIGAVLGLIIYAAGQV